MIPKAITVALKAGAAKLASDVVEKIAVPAAQKGVEAIQNKINSKFSEISDKRAASDALELKDNFDFPNECETADPQNLEEKIEFPNESDESDSQDLNENFEFPNETEREPKSGGSYNEVKEHSNGDTHEIHHMPADSISILERGDGPAIKMEKADHRKTASYGSSHEAIEYREKQKELIDNGDFRGAVQMDIDDIKSKFGNKYDKAISQMLDYVDKLEQEGKI
ncbi:MAG: hypothetical protein NC299_18480 [Lachnospiraceae bacterium]|nr:hypothetical protein [Lachnospiraceae bacterium]